MRSAGFSDEYVGTVDSDDHHCYHSSLHFELPNWKMTHRIRLLMHHRLARIRLLLHRVSNKHGLSDHPIRMPFHGIQSLFFDLNGFQTFKFRTSKCSKHSERIERCSLMKRKFQRESSDAKRDSH